MWPLFYWITHSGIANQNGASKIIMLMTSGELGQYWTLVPHAKGRPREVVRQTTSLLVSKSVIYWLYQKSSYFCLVFLIFCEGISTKAHCWPIMVTSWPSYYDCVSCAATLPSSLLLNSKKVNCITSLSFCNLRKCKNYCGSNVVLAQPLICCSFVVCVAQIVPMIVAAHICMNPLTTSFEIPELALSCADNRSV